MTTEVIDKWYLDQVRSALAVSKAVPTQHTILLFSKVNAMSLNDIEALTYKQLLRMIVGKQDQNYPNFNWNVYNAFALNMAMSNRLSMTRYCYLTKNYGKQDATGSKWIIWSYKMKLEEIAEAAEALPMSQSVNFVPKYRDWESTSEYRVPCYRIRKIDTDKFIDVFKAYQMLIKEIHDTYKQSILGHLEEMPKNDFVFMDKPSPKDLNKKSSFLDPESRSLIANLTNRYNLGANVVSNNLLPPTYKHNVLFNL